MSFGILSGCAVGRIPRKVMLLKKKCSNYQCWLTLKNVQLLSSLQKKSGRNNPIVMPQEYANEESSSTPDESTTSCKDLVPVIEAYLEIGMVNRATPIFDQCRRKGHKFAISTYNKILSGWLEQGNGFIAQRFWKSMLRDNMSPNLKTYGIWLSYHSRQEDWTAVEEFLADLTDKGHDLSKVLREGKLIKKEASQIWKIMLKYGIFLTPPKKLSSKYPLFLKSLYEDGTGCTSSKSCIPKEMFNNSSTGDSVLMDRFSRQIEQDKNITVEIESVATIKTKKGMTKGNIYDMVSKWRKELTAVVSQDIEEFIATCELFPNQTVMFETQFPLLAALPAKAWADICIDEVVLGIMCQPGGLSTGQICSFIGYSAHKQIKLRRMAKSGVFDKINKVYKDYLTILSENSFQQPSRLIWEELDEKYLTDGCMDDDSCMPYQRKIFHQAAASVVSRFLDVAKIPESICGKSDEYAFEHVIVYMRKNLQKGYIRPTLPLVRLLKKLSIMQEKMFTLNSSSMPMLIPPVPWISHRFGGHPFCNPNFMRLGRSDSVLLEDYNLDVVYDAVNYISCIPWKINGKMLDVVTEIFINGGNEELRIPSNPYNDKETFQNLSKAERKEFSEQFSLWMDMFYRLSLSEHFRKDIFWLPHDLDFRGRCYPSSTHLSHITMDAGRSLLTFANGEPLGERGFMWLKIHLMNMYGIMKKESMEDRLKYFETIRDNVIDSANNPLTGKQWWTKGSSPFQVLASCMEFTNAVESSDPATYISYLPIHQDGSCNGLQHYSALGRDVTGGRMVNLIDSTKPFDTYMEVASLVEDKRKKDAEAGSETAKLLEGCISRKVVKQTVMTTVYGVTPIGARLQVQKQLPSSLDKSTLFESAMYVTKLIFEVLSSRFQETRSIQKWLTRCAALISRTGHNVEWITPLGLPVLQPYHKEVQKNLKTVLQTFVHSESSLPNVAKQKSAFPPNFIHSIDSSHMMMTGLGCLKNNIQFVAVHDSFWTNAKYIDELNKICREQFVNLHKESILDDLAEYFEEQYGNLRYWDKANNVYDDCNFPTLPPRGSLDLKNVLTSTYFFS